MYDTVNQLSDMTLSHITPWFVWFLFLSHVILIGSFLLLGTLNESYVEVFSKVVRYFVCISDNRDTVVSRSILRSVSLWC